MPAPVQEKHEKSPSKLSPNNNAQVHAPENDDEEMTWKHIAEVYDAFWIRLYFLIILVTSFVFLLAMASNQF
jgi:hypothetical protein